jgi:hypothetical protein
VQPIIEQFIDEETVKNLSASKDKVRQLYPILVDAEGNIIDGLHRKEADKNWETKKLEWVKTEKDRIIARVHVNNYRRTVTKAERRRDFNRLAEIASAEGVSRQNIASTLAEWTGFSDDYVRELLDPKYKHQQMSLKAKERTEGVRVEPEVSVKEVRSLPQYNGFENSMKLVIGILDKWEKTYEKDCPATAKVIESLKQQIMKFFVELTILRKPEKTPSAA